VCYDDGARPPLPPIRGAAADARELTLSAADGVEVAAYAARAGQEGGPGIVILPDVRGLHPFFEELALRFAERGMAAVAFDYFGRTAGAEKRDDGFEYRPHGAEGGRAERIYTVGFCFGGRLSYLQAADGPELDGVIGFYGWPVGDNRDLPAPVDLVSRFRAPVLALWGGADQGITPDIVEHFVSALVAAGVRHESVVYPGAPHSFFDRRAADFADASDDAWRRMLDFVGAGEAPGTAG
jgi:carboxymethylenebutenolidase